MECRKLLTNDNLTHVLFTLDAYGALEVGSFVAVGYSNRGRFVAATRRGLARIVDNFGDFERVEIMFECDEELARALGAQVLQYAR